jgi:hypothetical protein
MTDKIPIGIDAKGNTVFWDPNTVTVEEEINRHWRGFDERPPGKSAPSRQRRPELPRAGRPPLAPSPESEMPHHHG